VIGFEGKRKVTTRTQVGRANLPPIVGGATEEKA
jgi:hypothetical protein